MRIDVVWIGIKKETRRVRCASDRQNPGRFRPPQPLPGPLTSVHFQVPPRFKVHPFWRGTQDTCAATNRTSRLLVPPLLQRPTWKLLAAWAQLPWIRLHRHFLSVVSLCTCLPRRPSPRPPFSSSGCWSAFCFFFRFRFRLILLFCLVLVHSHRQHAARTDDNGCQQLWQDHQHGMRSRPSIALPEPLHLLAPLHHLAFCRATSIYAM